MARRRQIYEGKAKILYEGPEPGTLIQYFKDDATAFNAQKRGTISGKGVINNRISEHIFTALQTIGVPTHFIRRVNMREQLIRQVEIIPIEVVVRNVSIGGEVQGTYSGASAVELFTIGELDRVWVLADLFEIDLGKVKQGSPVSVKVVSYPNRIFEGVVDYVSGTLDPTTRTAKVRISVDNKDRLLKPEMYATVQISIDQRKALAIPRTALLRLGDQSVVFAQVGTTAKGELKFERRPVAVDEEQGGDYLPVTHGLAEGDRIVSSGAILLLGML